MNKRNEDPRRDLCARIHEDDGVNPRLERKDNASRNTRRKDLQLCAQVADALNTALQSDAGSPILRGLLVLRVEPAPNASRVRVVVRDPAHPTHGAGEVIHELRRARSFLRLAIGEAISRKRVPDLIFAIAPHEEVPDEE